jgi:hypothetical protein
MRKPIAVALIGATMLLAAPPANARSIVVDRANGDYATATANGDVRDPKALFVKVKTNPTNKRVHVTWSVFCYRPGGSGSSSGDFSGRTSMYKQVRMPFANPGNCGFSATARLSAGSAHLTVVLLARV